MAMEPTLPKHKEGHTTSPTKRSGTSAKRPLILGGGRRGMERPNPGVGLSAPATGRASPTKEPLLHLEDSGWASDDVSMKGRVW